MSSRERPARAPTPRFALAVAGVLAFSGFAVAATVTLKDGTVIQGDVKSLQDGIYTIESAALGTVHVSEQQVRSVEEGAGAPTTPNAGAGGAPSASGFGALLGGTLSGAGALDAAKSLIAQDPQLLTTVLELQSDPQMIAVLNDPEIMKAIAAGDYASLTNNPKIVALMQNPKVRALVEAVQ